MTFTSDWQQCVLLPTHGRRRSTHITLLARSRSVVCTYAPRRSSTRYDWVQISTVCVFGALDPAMLCHAHSHGARVTFGSGGLSVSQWHNQSAVDAWVTSSVQRVTSAFADGLNIDIELAASAPADVAALTALTAKMAAAMHAAVPGPEEWGASEDMAVLPAMNDARPASGGWSR